MESIKQDIIFDLEKLQDYYKGVPATTVARGIQEAIKCVKNIK